MVQRKRGSIVAGVTNNQTLIETRPGVERVKLLLERRGPFNGIILKVTRIHGLYVPDFRGEMLRVVG